MPSYAFSLQTTNPPHETTIMKVIWNGKTLAESNAPEILEGRYYFPRDSVLMAYLKSNGKFTEENKGEIEHFDIVAGDETLSDGAWSIASSSTRASNLRGYIAFSDDVTLVN